MNHCLHFEVCFAKGFKFERFEANNIVPLSGIRIIQSFELYSDTIGTYASFSCARSGIIFATCDGFQGTQVELGNDVCLFRPFANGFVCLTNDGKLYAYEANFSKDICALDLVLRRKQLISILTNENLSMFIDMAGISATIFSRSVGELHHIYLMMLVNIQE